ncbi:hypothetical protein DFQ26_004128, partial [Actinomortierella ambigua]
KFVWGSEDWSWSKREHPVLGNIWPVLTATLVNNAFQSVNATVDLNSNIKNFNGSLTYVPTTIDQGNQDIGLFCYDFKMLRGHILKAYCQNEAHKYVSTEIDTALYLGNVNGTFVWGGKDWSSNKMGDPVIPKYKPNLSAVLYMSDRLTKRPSTVNLAERIRNLNGQLTYMEPAK